MPSDKDLERAREESQRQQRLEEERRRREQDNNQALEKKHIDKAPDVWETTDWDRPRPKKK